MKKRFISSLLAMAMLVSMGTTAFAGLIPESNDIDAPNGSTDVPVELTVTPLSFSVTVPSVLPITVNGEGEVTVADEVKIINNSQGKVEVKSLELTTSDGWSLNTMNSDFANMPVNSKVLGMSFNGKDATEGNLADTFAVIDANGEQEFTYAANLAPQSEEILGVNVASAVFTIGWYTENVIPTRKPMFSMIHRPSNTVTAVNTSFDTNLVDINEYDEDIIEIIDQAGYSFNLYSAGEYSANITEEKVIMDDFISIHYGEQGKISLSRDMLGKTFADLGEYSVIADWSEDNPYLDKTELNFYIVNNIPVVMYTYYNLDGSIENTDIENDNYRKIWLLDTNSKTFTLATYDTVITENMILYVDGSEFLFDAAQ